MKGLFKNNYYTALLSVKTFLIIMLLSGAFVVIFDTKPPALLISNYMLLGMIGFPFLLQACKKNAMETGAYIN